MSRAESPLRGRMIFNVGSRRSGTFWLQRIVTAHPGVSAVGSETHLFSHGIAPLAERFHHAALGSAQVGSTFIERDALLDALRDFCDAVFAPMIEPGRARLAERTPLHALHTGLIGDIYPDGRIVHIIRDGRDVVRSLLAQQWGPENVAEGAREWRAAIETARAGAGDSARYLEVRYEDLHADPATRISGLYHWLGLPVDDAILEHALAEAKVERNLDPQGTRPLARASGAPRSRPRTSPRSRRSPATCSTTWATSTPRRWARGRAPACARGFRATGPTGSVPDGGLAPVAVAGEHAGDEVEAQRHIDALLGRVPHGARAGRRAAGRRRDRPRGRRRRASARPAATARASCSSPRCARTPRCAAARSAATCTPSRRCSP